jgi:large conductance mechanosensitive channel
VMFLIVKRMNKLRKPVPAPAAPPTKECPFCLSSVPLKAVRCPHCTSDLK